MSKKLADETKPNRRMVEQLLRELARGRSWDEPECSRERSVKLSEEYVALRDELLSDPRLLKLEAELEKLRREEKKLSDRRHVKLRRVRQKYLANGVTPAVLRALDEIVEELNGTP